MFPLAFAACCSADSESLFWGIDKLSFASENPQQLWAHRGFHAEGLEPNSLAAIERAWQQGFSGVEIDIWYSEDNAFQVQHDDPRSTPTTPGKLYLKDVLEKVLPKGSLWLDFKNLSTSNAKSSGALLQELVSALTPTGFVWVESTNAEALNIISDSYPNLYTILWLHRYGELSVCSQKEQRRRTLISGVSPVSIPENHIDDTFIRDFRHMRIHTFTVNNAERSEELFRQGVQVILTDKLL